MPWQIQARPKVADDNAEWEPITFERAKLVAGLYQRRYQYETLEEAKQAFGEYVEVEGGLPNLLVRMASGSERFTDRYEVRFVQLLPENEHRDNPGQLSEASRRILDVLNRDIERLRGELDAANQHVKILQADRNAGIAACIRSCVQTIQENRMAHSEAVEYLLGYANAVARAEQPASGPGGFAAVPPGSRIGRCTAACRCLRASRLTNRALLGVVRGLLDHRSMGRRRLESGERSHDIQPSRNPRPANR